MLEEYLDGPEVNLNRNPNPDSNPDPIPNVIVELNPTLALSAISPG